MEIDYDWQAYCIDAVGIRGIGGTAAHAQGMKATSLEQAELAGLSAEKRAEVERRATQPGQTVSEVLTTMLLNGIKNEHKASSIVALDFGRGVAVVELQGGGMTKVNFDTTTLAIK
ncbi:MAG: hypothetical protein ISP49_17130 [Reyranella sp.]|nr:hypothetical protein [Reyranella sp.]MBL6653323.1 hypothetical protein [Reyranella sp.]